MQTINLASKLTIAGVALFGAALFNPAQAATNRAPVVTGTPVTKIAVGQAYAFQPKATDADGNTVWFWVENRPSWLTIDEKTGRLSGTPKTSDIGVHEKIKVAGWDSKAAGYLPTFSITVVAGASGQKPTISGKPATAATVGATYSFKPAAFDMDGDSLTFSIVGKPAWATLNKSTGALTGTPTAANVGVYPNVEIAVSDGKSVVKMAKFTITVNPASAVVTKNVSLSWDAPTQNVDGSALTNLSGYRIVYGTQPGSYTQSISVNTVGLTRYTIENLKAGKYYFAVIAKNSAGVESPVSVEINTSL